MQAYWLQLETEWLRSERALAGVLSFCYLTNNYGFTGDWFVGPIKDLAPGPTLDWFRHCFAPVAVFVNLADERYVKSRPPHAPGSVLLFNLVGVNDFPQMTSGKVRVRLLDASAKSVAEQTVDASVPGYGKSYIPVSLTLPKQPGGYLLLAEFTPSGAAATQSRRYIRVGTDQDKLFKFSR